MVCPVDMVISRVWLFVTPWTIAHQDPLPVEISRQQYWSQLPFPLPGDRPHTGIKPTSRVCPALVGGFFTTAPPGKLKTGPLPPKSFQSGRRSSVFISVQSLSRVRLFATPWTAARQVSLSITNSRSLPKLMSIELVMPSSLCRPLLLLLPIPPSIRVFSNESTLRMRWPKCWSFSFSISPSDEHPGLISFRMDWLDLLAVQVVSYRY